MNAITLELHKIMYGAWIKSKLLDLSLGRNYFVHGGRPNETATGPQTLGLTHRGLYVLRDLVLFCGIARIKGGMRTSAHRWPTA